MVTNVLKMLHLSKITNVSLVLKKNQYSVLKMNNALMQENQRLREKDRQNEAELSSFKEIQSESLETIVELEV